MRKLGLIIVIGLAVILAGLGAWTLLNRKSVELINIPNPLGIVGAESPYLYFVRGDVLYKLDPSKPDELNILAEGVSESEGQEPVHAKLSPNKKQIFYNSGNDYETSTAYLLDLTSKKKAELPKTNLVLWDSANKPYYVVRTALPELTVVDSTGNTVLPQRGYGMVLLAGNQMLYSLQRDDPGAYLYYAFNLDSKKTTKLRLLNLQAGPWVMGKYFAYITRNNELVYYVEGNRKSITLPGSSTIITEGLSHEQYFIQPQQEKSDTFLDVYKINLSNGGLQNIGRFAYKKPDGTSLSALRDAVYSSADSSLYFIIDGKIGKIRLKT